MRIARRAPLASVFTILLSLSLLAATAMATPYWGESEIARYAIGEEAAPTGPAAGPGAGGVSAEIARLLNEEGEAGALRDTDYLAVYSLIAEFLDVWQVDRPGFPDDGGIREGEHLQDIIQTDNTSEAIWVWARYYELTGDNQYYENILDAFTYSLLHPAYAEEGGSLPSTGYYRMYNCGWAARAELKFRQVYGDDTYLTYGNACADYIRDNYLDMSGPVFNDRVNPPVLSWAAGNLYHRGVADGNPSWIAGALTHAQTRVKPWVEASPTILALEEWAMAGGATMWGLLTSYFLEHPEEAAAWLATYKGYMDLDATPGSFTNAWRGWYALGHRAVGETLNDEFHLAAHLALADILVAEDGDADGGIPARPEETDNQDQTWVANYLAFMGLDPLLSDPASAPWLADGAPALRLRPDANPAPGAVRLRFELAQPGPVTLEILDAGGRRMATLREGEADAGAHTLLWRGLDAAARPVPAGAYFARLSAGGTQAVEKLLIVR